jgi:phosphonatase-like hydrolase
MVGSYTYVGLSCVILHLFMEIDLIVFDLAGTTVHDNNDVHRVLQQALKHFEVDISIEEANEVMGIPKPIAIRALLQLKKVDLITDKVIHDIHQFFVKAMIAFYQTDESVKEKEGASELFKSLKENGTKVVVDTGFDRPITNAILDRLGWINSKLIDGSVCSDEVENGRPHPDMIFKAMQLAGVTDINKVAKVGDTASDMQEGTSAGCGLVIGITSGAFSREALLKEPHTHLIDSLWELPEVMIRKAARM